MATEEYIKYLKNQAVKGLHYQTEHDKECGQLHTITRDAIREILMLDLVEARRLNGEDAVAILPGKTRF